LSTVACLNNGIVIEREDGRNLVIDYMRMRVLLIDRLADAVLHTRCYESSIRLIFLNLQGFIYELICRYLASADGEVVTMSEASGDYDLADPHLHGLMCICNAILLRHRYQPLVIQLVRQPEEQLQDTEAHAEPR
jgi:hypothetical protein